MVFIIMGMPPWVWYHVYGIMVMYFLLE